MNPSVTDINVVTHKGKRLVVKRVQHWIDASSKTGSARMPGKKELRTASGAPIPFDGSVFTLPEGDTFDPPTD